MKPIEILNTLTNLEKSSSANKLFNIPGIKIENVLDELESVLSSKEMIELAIYIIHKTPVEDFYE